MIDVISVDNMRLSDAAAIRGGIPSLELMARAAQGIYDSFSYEGKTDIYVGSGNNGGDGFALACILASEGNMPTIVSVADHYSEDAAYYKKKAEELGVAVIPYDKDAAKFIENAAEEGSVIYSTGNLTICNVEVVPVEDDDKAPIYNLGNITSKTIITVLDNSSYPFYGKICLNATITTNGIPVAKENLRFIINGQEILALATDDGLYTADYSGFITEDQIVTASYDGATDVEVKTGILLKNFYTFTDLQALINKADDKLDLPNDFYYDPNVDSALKNGVVINKSITINGNGYTIDGKNLARMFVVKSEDVEIDNITFINGNTGGNGGAIDVYNSTTISGCNFTNNFATSNGGAINFQEGSTSTIENCIFTANRANGVSGGAIYTPNVELNIIDSIFKDNYAQSSGSAIQSWKSIYIDGCSFDSNEANGGATLMFDYETDTSCYVVVKNSNFTNNKATSVGAVQIINSESSDNLIENCLFANNSATSANVGALYISATGAKVINSTFYNNTAITNGGAASLKGDIAVENCNFTLNNAAEAGAIRARNGVNITNCMFDSNKAGAGGALMTEGSVIVKESNFIDNTANNGSTIYNKGNLNITDSSATNIDGDNKAPIYNLGTITSKTVITVLDNSSYPYVEGNTPLNATITASGIRVTGQDLLFNINGETVTATETETSLYEVNYTNPITENQIVTASYAGATDVDVKTGRIVANKVGSEVNVTLPESIKEGENATITVNVPEDAEGNATLTIDGEVYATEPVKNGVATFTIDDLTAGSHNVEVTYSGDNYYNSSSAKATLNIKPATVATKITASNMKFTAYATKNLVITLKDANGKILAGKKVVITFNGKNYTRTTDSKGQAKLAITSKNIKVYTATIKFAGEDNYLASSKSVKINITAAYVTVADIIKAAKYLKSYSIKNKKLPATIKVGAYKLTHAQLSYLMTNAIKKIKAGKKVSTKVKVINVKATTYNTKGSKKIYKAQYMKVVNNLYNQGVKGKLPKYIKYNGKIIGYNAYTYSLAKILAFYSSKNRLPNYCVFKRY